MFHFFPVDQSDPFAPPAFQLDATTREESIASVMVTGVPIEAEGNIADHVYPQPDEHRVEGMLSPIMPLASPQGVDGVKAQVAEAIRLLKRGTVLTCVFGFSVETVVLTKAVRTLTHGDGFALRASLEFKELRQISTEFVTIPASRLRKKGTRAVKRQAAPPAFAQKWIAQGGKRANKVFGHHLRGADSGPIGPVVLRVDPEAD
jgi:hypothetical protein